MIFVHWHYRPEQVSNMLVKVNGTNLIRDTNSMALINTDNNEKNEYYAKRKLLQNQKTEINNVKEEIQELKKTMLQHA